MNLNEVRKIIDDIIEIVSDLTPEYRSIAFELLLTKYLQPERTTVYELDQSMSVKGQERKIIHIDVRAFLAQFGIDQYAIETLFMIGEDEIRPTYTLQPVSKLATQKQLALLLSLENALNTGSFGFDPYQLRERLETYGAYDKNHFKQNLRRLSNFFKSLENQDWIELSAEGKAELAQTIWELTK